MRSGQLLFTLIALSTLIDLFFFTGYFSSDDISYYGFARHAWKFGEFPNANQIGGFRLVVVGWNWLMIMLFGPSPAIVSATYILFHQLLNCLVYLLGRRLFSSVVGLLAAHLTAVSPLMIVFASMILPDILSAAFFVLSLYAFFQAYDREPSVERPTSGWWMFLCGIAVGGAYSAKESGLILLPFYLVLWLLFSRGRSVRTAFWIGVSFVAGVAVIFAIEFFTLSWLLHQWIFRLTWTVEDLDPATRQHIGRYGTDVGARLQWVFERLRIFYAFLPGMVGWLLLVAPVAYVLLRGKRWPVLALLLWLFGYQTFGSMRLGEYLPPSIQARYYIPVLPFAHLILAFVLVYALVPLRRVPNRTLRNVSQGLAIAAMVIMPWFCLPIVNQQAGLMHRASTMGNAARALQFVGAQNDAPVVVSSFLRFRLDNHLADFWPEWLIDANSVDMARLKALLDAGGFYYVETNFQPTESQYPVDELMHRIAGSAFQHTSTFDWGSGAKPRYYHSKSDSLVGRIQLGNLDIVVRNVGWFLPMTTRTADFGVNFGHNIVVKDRIGPINRQSVRVFRVTGSNAGRQRNVKAGHNTASTQPLMNDHVAPQFDLSEPAVWKTSITRRFQEDKGVSIDISTAAAEGPTPRMQAAFSAKPDHYGWLVPDWNGQRAFELDGASLFEIDFDAQVIGPGKAEIRLEVFSDPGCQNRLYLDRTPLGKGRRRLRLATDMHSIWFRPAIKLTGHGELTLACFSICQVE